MSQRPRGDTCGRASRPAWAACAAALALLAAPSSAAQETAEQRLLAARQAFDRKDYGRARSLASRIVSREPASPVVVEAWLVVIDSLMEQQSWARAFEECEKLLTAHPDTKWRQAVLRRELQIGEAMAASRVSMLFFSLPRLEEGVKVLERVIEHAPFGPLADRALYAIGEARFSHGDWAGARDAYERLLEEHPRSELAIRARVRRATCNERLAVGPPYDLAPARAAREDLEELARLSGSEEVASRARGLRDMMARSEYESGLFYFNRYSIDGGVRYMRAVVSRYPETEYAERAQRILALVKRLTDQARSEGRQP